MDCFKGLVILISYLFVTSAHDHSDEFELLVVGGLTNRYNNTELVDPKRNTSCKSVPVPDFISGGFGGYFNGHAMVCSFDSQQCFTYNKRTTQWFFASDMNKARNAGAFALIKHKQVRSRKSKYPKNAYLWAVGGSNDIDGYPTSTDLYKDLIWKDPNIDLPAGGQHGPCLVSISRDEIAFFGGHNDNGFSKDIYVFNWRTKIWDLRGQLPTELAHSACALIREPASGHYVVMIAGGFSSGNLPETDVYFWDPVTSQVTQGPSVPIPATTGSIFVRGDTAYLAVPADTQELYSFSFKKGWKYIRSLMFGTSYSIIFSVPKNLFRCN